MKSHDQKTLYWGISVYILKMSGKFPQRPGDIAFLKGAKTMGSNEMSVYTVKEASAILKTSCQQVRRMIRNKELEAIMVGREWRIQENKLKDFLDGK